MNKKFFAYVAGGAALLLLLAVVILVATPRSYRSGVPSFAPSSMMSDQTDAYGKGMMDFNVDEESSANKTGMMAYPVPEEPTAGETAADTDQKIIKTGSLGLIVDDVAETESRIAQFATEAGGYVQTSDTSERTDGTHSGNIAVRVPSEQFESSMGEFKTYANAVKTETAQGQDVTEQYTDLQAQLRNAEAQEDEYLRILTKTSSVDDILSVQSYLSGVRAQIESLQGRIQYLENRTSYSTITVSLAEEPSVSIPTKNFRFGATVREAFQGLVAILQNLAVIAVWLLIVGGGVLIPLVVFIWIVVKLIVILRRRYAKKGHNRN